MKEKIQAAGIKIAMLAVDNWLQRSGVDARMIMQVHDELVLEVATAEVEAVAGELSRLMSAAAQLAIPLVVDTGVGDN